MRDAKLPAAADERDLESRLERDVKVAREPVALDREQRLGVADADEQLRAAVLVGRGDGRIQELLGFFQRLAVEQLRSLQTRCAVEALLMRSFSARERIISGSSADHQRIKDQLTLNRTPKKIRSFIEPRSGVWSSIVATNRNTSRVTPTS